MTSKLKNVIKQRKLRVDKPVRDGLVGAISSRYKAGLLINHGNRSIDTINKYHNVGSLAKPRLNNSGHSINRSVRTELYKQKKQTEFIILKGYVKNNGCHNHGNQRSKGLFRQRNGLKIKQVVKGLFTMYQRKNFFINPRSGQSTTMVHTPCRLRVARDPSGRYLSEHFVMVIIDKQSTR